jgi:transcriptional regulator with XRE-family HTH domain
MKNFNQRHQDSRYRIGTNIRKWRGVKDMKQKDLAVSLGLSEAAVSNIENDMVNVTLSQLEDISTALDITLEQLLSDPQQAYVKAVTAADRPVDDNLDRQLVKAMITSLQKKDEQIQELLNHLLTDKRRDVLLTGIGTSNGVTR